MPFKGYAFWRQSTEGMSAYLKFLDRNDPIIQDEWEYICGAGAETLFRWGDHVPCDCYPTDVSPAEAAWRREWVLSAGTLAYPEGGFECETEGRGICREGATTCAEAVLTCVQVREPEAEKCNQLDDDCDGIYDEVDTVGRPCFTGRDGVCADGTTQCVRGANECVPVIDSSNEVCDGLDNDCDGLFDELEPGAGEACETGWGGACGMGVGGNRASIRGGH